MATLAELVNARLRKYTGAPGKSLSVDIEHHGTDNAEFYQFPGFHSKPQDGSQCVVIDCNGNNIVVASHDYRFNTEIQKGETLIYSYDSDGALKAKILLNASGEIVANDGTDYAVKYSKLESEFNKLKTSFNNLLTEYQAHTHPYVDTPIGASTTSPTVSTQVANASDITLTKVEKVRL